MELLVLFAMLVCPVAIVGVVLAVVFLTTKARRGAEGNLIPCPDCGRQISVLADNCPNCGRPMKPGA
jgi:predicted amidophosphoribosyltransferase